ncbi:MAG: ribulose-phosphate 3-epimerase [Candidatus Altiarchaeota archaeon]|nr:ribulose-phosphate 3-epimerase [Candidatus Altiarchaeota archaeon]
MSKMISASILSADFSCLGEEIKKAETAGVDWLHIDVMDGVFVPNISIGLPVIDSMRKVTKLFFDVHLMIVEPERYISYFRQAGANLITVHFESTKDVKVAIAEVKKSGAKVGVSLKPETPFEEIEPLLQELDLVLFMGVEPGFGGQRFNPNVITKIKTARAVIDKRGLKTLIEVDGGVNEETIPNLSKAGVDVFVAGSYIFSNPKGVAYAISKLRDLI